jgi:hypothetical protein
MAVNSFMALGPERGVGRNCNNRTFIPLIIVTVRRPYP